MLQRQNYIFNKGKGTPKRNIEDRYEPMSQWERTDSFEGGRHTQKERAVVCALIISHTVALRDRQPDDGVIYHRDKKECKNSELLLLVWGQTEHVNI